jgi:hypothetical protein
VNYFPKPNRRAEVNIPEERFCETTEKKLYNYNLDQKKSFPL